MSSILHQHFFAANIIFFCYGAEIELNKKKQPCFCEEM